MVPSGANDAPATVPPNFLRFALEALLEGVAKGVVRRNEIPFLSVFIEQELGNGVGLHSRRVADAEHVPVAVRAGDRIGVASSHDVQHTGPAREVAESERHRGVDVAEEEVDLVAVDQQVALCTATPASVEVGILRNEGHRAAEDAALLVDLVDGELAADLLVFAELRVSARERIVEADLDWFLSKRLNDERAGDLHRAGCKAGLGNGPAADWVSKILKTLALRLTLGAPFRPDSVAPQFGHASASGLPGGFANLGDCATAACRKFA